MFWDTRDRSTSTGDLELGETPGVVPLENVAATKGVLADAADVWAVACMLHVVSLEMLKVEVRLVTLDTLVSALSVLEGLHVFQRRTCVTLSGGRRHSGHMVVSEHARRAGCSHHSEIRWVREGSMCVVKRKVSSVEMNICEISKSQGGGCRFIYICKNSGSS